MSDEILFMNTIVEMREWSSISVQRNFLSGMICVLQVDGRMLFEVIVS